MTTIGSSPTQGQPLIHISEGACRRLVSMMREKALTGYGLRVFVAGGGCSGLRYGMAFDNERREGDNELTSHDLWVLIDPVSARYLRGATIEYVDELMGGGFKIENPNATANCGCGQSFRTDEEGYSEEEEAQNIAGCSSCPSYE